jgi:phage terminase large subunit-like protein
MTDRGYAADNVDDKLTFAVLKKVQQRLHGTEQRVEVVESELLAFRELQLSMLKDLQRIYQLLGRHHESLDRSAVAVPPPPTSLRREDDRKV